MSATNKLGKGLKFASVVLGALAGGFMWRARGTHGFGSFWGLAAVGTVFALLLFSFYGNRSKVKYELIPVGALMLGFGVTGWGSVVQMPGGVINGGPAAFETAAISQGRGALMMFLTGFSILALFGVYVGTLFSERKYKLYHYLIYIAVFFAVQYIVMATFAHNLIGVLAPEVRDAFTGGIKSAGIDGTAKSVYLTHFNSASFAKTVGYGRAYFECIDHIGSAIGAVAVIITALIMRDGLSAILSCVISTGAGIAITLADYFQICTLETSFLSGLNIPAFLRIRSWEVWEFFTGFLLGLFIMLAVALIPGKYSEGRKYRSEPYIENRGLRFAINFLLFSFAFAAVPARALAFKASRNALEYGFIKDSDVPEIVAAAVLGVIFAAVLFAVMKKTILDRNLPVAFKMKPARFAPGALLALFSYYGAAYFLTGEAPLVRFIYRKAVSSAPFEDGAALVLALGAFALFILIFIPVKKRMKKYH